eukprot:COSAG02_NODE_1160_length_14177_cov_208.515130_13_plen_81_part_00
MRARGVAQNLAPVCAARWALGRRNLLGIDTNLGYVALCGGGNLLTYRAGGAIGKEVGYRHCGAEFGGCGSRSSRWAWRTR